MTEIADAPPQGEHHQPRTLSLYLPGSCEQLVDELRTAFVQIAPGTQVLAARVAMTGTLAAEVLAGAPADVVLSANEAYLAQLHVAGLVPRPVPFARNRLAIFVRPDASDRVHALDDLTRDDVRTLVFPAANDPGGAYTVELFARAGLTERMADQQAKGQLIV